MNATIRLFPQMTETDLDDLLRIAEDAAHKYATASRHYGEEQGRTGFVGRMRADTENEALSDMERAFEKLREHLGL